MFARCVLFPLQLNRVAVGFKQTIRSLHVGLRLKAFITDVFMIYTPLLYITTYFILGSAQAFRENQIAIFACVCMYGLISALFLSLSAQTPGLRYVGLELVRKDRSRVGFMQALLRFFLWLLGVALLVGLIFPFISSQKRFLHDILCGTDMITKIRD